MAKCKLKFPFCVETTPDVVFVFVLVIAFTAAVHTQQPPPTPTPTQIAERRVELENILDRYAAGDHETVARSVGKMDTTTRAALRDWMTDKDAPWRPARAAFALEIANSFGLDMFWDLGVFVGYGLSMIDRRPEAIGTNTADDRFELLYHQIALGMFESTGGWPMHHSYLTRAASRLDKLEAKYPQVSNRIPLMRALDNAMQCCSKELIGGANVGMVTQTFSSSRPVPSPAPSVEYATFLYEQAARNPALRQEALVRAAYIQERYDHANKGLELIERATSPGDPIIEYAAGLIRGGLFDRKGRPADAAESYAAALTIAPGAQVPAIGLAAALQRAGKIDEALQAAQRARRMAPDGFDPWPDFLRADARFVQSWMTQLRGMLK